jgi:hypothetical protein
MAEMTALVQAQLAPAPEGIDLAEAWLGGLLELPPEPMERLIASAVAVAAKLGAADRERFSKTVAQAAARFHVPQLIRLKDTFARIGRELGQNVWS